MIDSKYFQNAVEQYGPGDKTYKYIRPNKFFGDRRVRLAISSAIDKQMNLFGRIYLYVLSPGPYCSTAFWKYLLSIIFHPIKS